MVRPVKILYLDVESTGVNPDVDQVIELACMMTSDEQPRVRDDVRAWRFKPSVPIHPKAQETHGISIELLADCPTFADRAVEIETVIRAAEVVVGYNVDFDLRMLRKEFERINRAWPALPTTIYLDAFALWKACESRSLAAAHERFVGRPLLSAHNAMADVRATHDVLSGMRQAFGLEAMTWAELATKADPARANRCGPSAHLRWLDDKLILTFGKHQGKTLVELRRTDAGYLKWVAESGNFPAHVAEACKRTLVYSADQLHAWARSLPG